MNETNEIKAKTFAQVVGRVTPVTGLSYTKIDTMYLLKFGFQSDSDYITVQTLNKKMIGKFCQLMNVEYGQILADLQDGKTTVEQVQQQLQDAVFKADREIVILRNDKGENVNFVSRKHKQLSMVDIHQMVQTVGQDAGAKPIGMQETAEGYTAQFEVSIANLGSMRVLVDYGRNDAQGRASIRFEGAGNIFVCSNMIIPYIHKSITTSAKLEQFKNPKIIHTLGVDGVARNRAREMFLQASEQARVLFERLEASKLVPMERTIQRYALQLIKTKHNISEKQMEALYTQLENEEQTLFGLSQTLTWVGTRADSTSVKNTLCRVGGQVVLLGAGIVDIFKQNFAENNIPLPEVQARV